MSMLKGQRQCEQRHHFTVKVSINISKQQDFEFDVDLATLRREYFKAMVSVNATDQRVPGFA